MSAEKKEENWPRRGPEEARRIRAQKGWEEARVFLRSCREHEQRSENVKMIPIT
jgi:hypothetical protein